MEGSKQLTDDDSDFSKALSMLDASDGTGGVVEDIIEMASSVFNQERPRLLCGGRTKAAWRMARGMGIRQVYNEHSRLVVRGQKEWACYRRQSVQSNVWY
jgi:hypothetical protein